MNIYARVFLLFVASFSTYAGANQAVNPVPRLVLSPAPQVFAASVMPSADEMRYFNAGLRAGSDAPNLNAQLDEFERRLKIIYGRLSRSLQKYSASKLSFFSEYSIMFHVKIASFELERAERLLFDGLGVKREQSMLPKSFSTEKGVEVYSPWVFEKFLNGLYRKSGRFIRVDFHRVRYGRGGRHLEVAFPQFCFSSGSVQTVAVPDSINDFLSSRNASAYAGVLYDLRITHIREVWMGSSRRYTQVGMENSCGEYGAVARVGAEREVQMFMGALAEKKFSKKVVEEYFKESVHIHEIMHYIFRNDCFEAQPRSTYIVDGKKVTRRQIDEAQATVAMLGVIAQSKPQALVYALVQRLAFSADPNYALVYEIFFRKLFKTLVMREIDTLKVRAAQSRGMAEVAIPRYAKISTQEHGQGNGSILDDMRFVLKSSGTTNTYSVNFDRATFVRSAELLLEAKPVDVLTAAHDTLKELADSPSAGCQGK